MVKPNSSTLEITSKCANNSLIAPLRERLLKLKQSTTDWCDGEESHCFCNDKDNLCRFLVARDNHLDNAYAMAAAALDWRCEIKPSELTVADFPTANAQGTWRFAGYATNGWPIILVRAGLWDSYAYTTEEYVKFIACFLETNARRMDTTLSPHGQRHFIIFDLKGMKYRCDMQKQKQLIKLANDYYPERLGIALVINANALFWGLWKLISPWMDKATSEKVRVFQKDYLPFLEEHVGLKNVPKDLGGTMEGDWPLLSEANHSSFCVPKIYLARTSSYFY